ncbi:major facilitator superfamily transporter [Whalleya microplaca]|nr:major facilitator superfamily transporter [Whalleya microplaca]
MSAPGTVSLVEFQVATESGHVVLSPTPSNDPNDPLNWKPWRKYVNYGLITAMTVAAFTSKLSIQTVFWQQMAVDLEVNLQQLNNSNSTQLAGLAVGCIFFIPIAVKYGRRPVYVLSTAVLAALCWWTARINTYAELVSANFLVGLVGSINETTVQMTISDIFFVHQRGRANALYFIAVMIGSFLCPMAAGAQAAAQGWRWPYYALAISFTVLAFVFGFFFEETKFVSSAANIVADNGPVLDTMSSSPAETHYEDSKARSDEDGGKKCDDSAGLYPVASNAVAEMTIPLNTYRQRMRFWTPTSESLPKVFMAPLAAIMFPHVIFTALQFASIVSCLVLLLTMTSIIFAAPPYSFNTAGVGYMALGPCIGNIIGSLYGGPFSDWSVTRLARRNGGIFEPEMRLYIYIVPVILMSGGIIMFGATADRGLHWIYPSIGGACFAFGLGAGGDIAFTFVIDSYRDLVAEAFVGVAFLRNAISICIPLALVPWMKDVGITNVHILGGCISLFIGLLHIPMIIWGKKIRVALAPRYYRLVERLRE